MQLCIHGTPILPGTATTIELPAGRLYTHTPMSIPVHVIRGRHDGPRLFVCAAIHGDEIIGVEIIRRLLGLSILKQLHGALIAIPIVNVHGLLSHSRYLPDRRDLNRSFPGSGRGSLASRLAHLFMNEVVRQSTHGIDIHSAGLHRHNLPQIRASMSDPNTARLAHAFGVPLILDSYLRDGSLRQAAADLGIPTLLYEAGEALRFDELSIRAGVKGILNVMRALDMLPPAHKKKAAVISEPIVASDSAWLRAPCSGILRPLIPPGSRVEPGTVLGVIADPFGSQEVEVSSPHHGIIIGSTHLPLVNEGDALFHIARFERIHDAEAELDRFHEEHQSSGDPSPTVDGLIK